MGQKRQDTEVPIICVVDDELSMLEAMVGLLESAGYLAKGFSSSEDFLAWHQFPSTACLIVDVMMPSISGFELHRRLTASNYRIPTIFITAHDDDVIRIRASKAGAVGFLLKPFSDESLFQAVGSALADRAAER